MPTAAGRVGRCPARPAQQPAGRSRAVSWAQRGWPYGAWLPACERDTPRTGVAPSAAAAHLSLGGDRGACGAVPLRFRLTSPGPAPAVACRLPRVTRESRKVPAQAGIRCAAAAASFMSWWLIAARRLLPASPAVAGSAPDLPGRLPASLMSLSWRRVSQTSPRGVQLGGAGKSHLGHWRSHFQGQQRMCPSLAMAPRYFRGGGLSCGTCHAACRRENRLERRRGHTHPKPLG